MKSLKERLDNPASRRQLERRLRDIALKELDLSVSDEPSQHAEKAAHRTISYRDAWASPDDDQSLTNLIVTPTIRELKEYVRAKQVSLLADEGVKVEIQPIETTYHIVTSIQY